MLIFKIELCTKMFSNLLKLTYKCLFLLLWDTYIVCIIQKTIIWVSGKIAFAETIVFSPLFFFHESSCIGNFFLSPLCFDNKIYDYNKQ